MSITPINLGTAPAGTDGDSHRDAWTKGNANFADLDLVTAEAKTSAFSLTNADNRKGFRCSGSFAVTVDPGNDDGWTATIANVGTGTVTFTAGSGVTLVPSDITLDNTTGATLTAATLLHLGDEEYLVLGPARDPVVIVVPLSDEGTDLTTGTGKYVFRMPFAMTLTGVRASVNTAPTGSGITVDINENSSSILSTKLTIDVSEKTSVTAATEAVIGDAALADDAELSFDVDAVGSTTPGRGLKVTLLGYRA